MNIYRPLRGCILIYDLIRLFSLVSVIILFMSPSEYSGTFQVPYLVYTAPNALFPLMAFFLLIRPRESHSYLSLYIAGKTVTISAALGWLVFFFFKLSDTLRIQGVRILILPGFILLAVTLDSLSVLGGMVLRNGFQAETVKTGISARNSQQGDEL